MGTKFRIIWLSKSHNRLTYLLVYVFIYLFESRFCDTLHCTPFSIPGWSEAIFKYAEFQHDKKFFFHIFIIADQEENYVNRIEISSSLMTRMTTAPTKYFACVERAFRKNTERN